MIEATMHVNGDGPRREGQPSLARSRTRTCVGCGERVDLLAIDEEVVRLILGPDGEIGVDPKGGGFGRGAHVHARRDCVERAARSGLLRATKGRARVVLGVDEGAPLGPDSLALAIQAAMNRRVEGLVASAVRSGDVAGDVPQDGAELVLVACDATADELALVERAVAEGRAAAWGTKQILGVGVVTIGSRAIATAIRRAVQAANAVGTTKGSGRARGARVSAPSRGAKRAR